MANSGAPYSITTTNNLNFAPGTHRNSADGPNYGNLDAEVSRTFRLPEKLRTGSHTTMTLFGYSQNILNHDSDVIIGSLLSPVSGLKIAAYPRRMIELGLRFRY